MANRHSGTELNTMMNVATTEFWLNNIYRPAGTRSHGMLQTDDSFVQWLGDRDPEQVAQLVMEEARISGRNPRTDIVRLVIARRLCKLATNRVLSDAQSRFVSSQIPEASEEPPVITGYADGRTTRDWLGFMNAGVQVSKDLRAGKQPQKIVEQLREQHSELNLDPLFINEFVKQQRPSHSRA